MMDSSTWSFYIKPRTWMLRVQGPDLLYRKWPEPQEHPHRHFPEPRNL